MTEHTLDRVVPWHEAVDFFIDQFPRLNHDTALILAVMAKESKGDPKARSSAGACGLMQVVRKPWMRESDSELCKSNFANIRTGERILQTAIDHAGGDIHLGLQIYYCGEVAVEDGRCIGYHGPEYADEILNFWKPRIEERLERGG